VILPFIDGENKITLVEPLDGRAAVLRRQWANVPNVTIHEVAITRERGPFQMVRRRQGSYIEGTVSPATDMDGPKNLQFPRLTVKGVPFSDIDDGTIDAFCLDVEGSEWVVLDTMTSRPKVIEMEWWSMTDTYETPDADKILEWMAREGYEEEEYRIRDGRIHNICRRWVKV
jgi:hypothetical protein